jgi:hypothetical protein
MTRDDPKTASFPPPAIAKHNSQPESLDPDDVDLGRDGVQGDVVVSKGTASTFVSKNTLAGDGK